MHSLSGLFNIKYYTAFCSLVIVLSAYACSPANQSLSDKKVTFDKIINSYARTQDLRAARERFLTFIENNPKDKKALYAMVVTSEMSGKYDDALIWLEKIIALTPADIKLGKELMVHRQRISNLIKTRSSESYNKSQEYFSRIRRARLLSKYGFNKEAVGEAALAERLLPQRCEALLEISYILFKSGYPVKAELLLTEAQNKCPDLQKSKIEQLRDKISNGADIRRLAYDGVEHVKNKNYNDAVEYFRKALLYRPGNARLTFLMAYSLLKAGDTSAANLIFQELVASKLQDVAVSSKRMLRYTSVGQKKMTEIGRVSSVDRVGRYVIVESLSNNHFKTGEYVVIRKPGVAFVELKVDKYSALQFSAIPVTGLKNVNTGDIVYLKPNQF